MNPDNLKILLVENHPDTLRWLTLYLEDAGHSVSAVRTIGEAIEKLRSGAHNLLLSDIGLPDGLGWDLPRAAKAFGRIQTIAMSGISATPEIDRSRAAGFDFYLLKPFKTAELDRVLEKAAKKLKEAPPNGSVDSLLIEANERAQRQIGHELHETLCQTLAGVSIFVSSLARRQQAGQPLDPNALKELDRQLHVGIDQARGLYRKFEPPSLDAAGLLDALDSLAKVTATVHPCEFKCEKPVIVSDSKLALAIYRTAQESVRNAIERSHGTKITISLLEDRGAIELCVSDNRPGLDPTRPPRFCGLTMIEAYARHAAATVSVESRPDLGVTVCLRAAPAPKS